jgi:hypothetical protein
MGFIKTFNSIIQELACWPTNDPMESGFQAGREYSANLVDEIVVEFIKEQLAQLDDEVIRANDSMVDWKMKLECR